MTNGTISMHDAAFPPAIFTRFFRGRIPPAHLYLTFSTLQPNKRAL